MYARAVDEAAARLRDLRHEAWEGLGLAACAIGLALGATEVRPALALPLFLAGVVAWALGIRALWRRWDLVDRLADEGDAYVIPEVRRYALRETTMARRRWLAGGVRSALRRSTLEREARVLAVAGDLEALARELEDERLALEPASAVACARMLTDASASPLLDAALPADDLRSRVARIRSGFTARLGT